MILINSNILFSQTNGGVSDQHLHINDGNWIIVESILWCTAVQELDTRWDFMTFKAENTFLVKKTDMHSWKIMLGLLLGFFDADYDSIQDVTVVYVSKMGF